MNDTLTGDPLMTVPILTDPDVEPGDDVASLCYEVHGEADAYFNLISDQCTSVNAYYQDSGIPNPDITLNVVTKIGVRAIVTNDGGYNCINIKVELNLCKAFVVDDIGDDDISLLTGGVYINGAVKVKTYPTSQRVRISVPNCSPSSLVMWVYCKNGSMADPDPASDVRYSFSFLRFVVMRGFNLNENSHGLIGKNIYSLLGGIISLHIIHFILCLQVNSGMCPWK